MGTDWFVKVQCPHPDKDVKSKGECITACSKCLYVIRGKPELVEGFIGSICGVRVGRSRPGASGKGLLGALGNMFVEVSDLVNRGRFQSDVGDLHGME